MKMLEDAFSYANQLARCCAVYLHAHHLDILRFLDTKRENADEKIRIKNALRRGDPGHHLPAGERKRKWRFRPMTTLRQTVWRYRH